MAKSDGFKFLLTMDQDSRFEDGVLEEYAKYASNYLLKMIILLLSVSHIMPIKRDIPKKTGNMQKK